MNGENASITEQAEEIRKRVYEIQTDSPALDLHLKLISLFIELTKTKPDKARENLLTVLCINAAQEALDNQQSHLAILLAGLPILFHDGRDPNAVPSVTIEPLPPGILTP